jgi:dTDP-4-amino-4,6-dideoxygalactose transaminase
MPVHLYGRMCDMTSLRNLADQNGLFIIEDAAHCIEGHVDGIRPANLGDTACFSFYATKNLTCGEGGALATNNTDLYKKLKLLRLHGMTHTGAERAEKGYQHWDMTLMGWKYNMSNIEAALLLPQIDRIEKSLARRTLLANRYKEQLVSVAGLRLLSPTPSGMEHAHHLFPILVEGMPRDSFIAALKDEGIGVVVNYRPVHLTQYFSETFGFKSGDFPIAEYIGENIVSLPLYPKMSIDDLDTVIRTIQSIMKDKFK